jgi:hypothetical protein
MYILIEPGAFSMERKMLIEIKRRAERLRRSRPPATAQAAPAAHPEG